MECPKQKGDSCKCCFSCVGRYPKSQDLADMTRDELESEVSRLTSLCQQFNMIIENSSDTLFVTNGDGVITLVNRAYEKLSGADRIDLIGKNVRDLPGSLISESSSAIALETGKSTTIEQKLFNTGRVSWVTSTPVYVDGEIYMVVSNNRDFTEIQQLRTQLNEAENKVAKYTEELARIRDTIIIQTNLVAEDRSSLNCLYKANKVAKVDTTVLITGETGVGKEEYAKYIHSSSPRSEKPFICINCGAIPANIIESELFGYEKGSFTGASSTGKKGLLEVANGGTVFLDEIGELPLDMQVKLLRVIQQKEITHVGGTSPIKIDVRFVCATNRNLRDMVKANQFREDLYYRISVVTLDIPPLRQRPDDILPLVLSFSKEINEKFGFDKKITSKALQLLKTYSWPGNIRELKNCVEEAFVMSDGDYVDVDDFVLYNSFDITHKPDDSLKTILERVEYRYLVEAMERHKSIRKAAKSLGIPASTYARRLSSLSKTNVPNMR